MGVARLDERFSRSLRALGVGEVPRHLLVALSGGVDSTVLLHLLRFRCQEMPLTLTAAHLDHRMRPSSGGDAAWVRGVCQAWGVPLEAGVARADLRSEAAARRARYDFLRAAAARVGADYVVTAHHADDQAETVLFRILRGTGLEGLCGIPERSGSNVIRPLLGFWRVELEAYAVANGIAWRTDPSNATLGPARNRIRLDILPRLEQTVSPAARRNLVALAALARESEAGWREILGNVYPALVETVGETLVIDREGLRRQHPAIGTRVVRKALRRYGIVPARGGTRSTLTFITDAPSGREIHLPGGVRIVTEFDRARIHRTEGPAEDTRLQIRLPAIGEESGGEVVIGGRRYAVRARVPGGGTNGDGPILWNATLRVTAPQFPLTVRGRSPGDGIRTRGGFKSVKKLMIERRIPRGERRSRPLVVDAAGAVLWVAGADVATNPAKEAFDLEILVRDAR